MNATQPALFEMPTAYAEAERIADRATCRAYMKRWARSFKKNVPTGQISREDFEAAAARLAA